MALTSPNIVSGKGVYLYDDTGRVILDGASGALVTNIGHGRPEVAAAVAEALGSVDYVVPVFRTPRRTRLAELLREQWLGDFDSFYFASGGSEANDSAIRLARMHHLAMGRPSRWKVIGREPSYHGSTSRDPVGRGCIASVRDGFDPLLADMAEGTLE